ncbi:MAG: hypothetical protein ACRCUS_07780, partial [Anaerovoracaceae bacterium]
LNIFEGERRLIDIWQYKLLKDKNVNMRTVAEKYLLQRKNKRIGAKGLILELDSGVSNSFNEKIGERY